MEPTRLKIASLARRMGLFTSRPTGWWFMQFQTLIDAKIDDETIVEVQGCVSWEEASELAMELGLLQPSNPHGAKLREAMCEALKAVAVGVLREYRADELRARLVEEQRNADD